MKDSATTIPIKQRTDTHYTLYAREGELAMYWQLNESAIALTDDGLSWSGEHGIRDYAYADIVSIRLQNAQADSSDMVGICLIRFRDGQQINVYGGNSMGGSDETQAQRYTVFVRDLHARLSPDDKARIAFQAGLSDTRFAVVTAALIATALLCGLLPLALLLIVPSWQVVGILGIGSLIVLGAWRLWDVNRPRRYSPEQLPPDLLP